MPNSQTEEFDMISKTLSEYMHDEYIIRIKELQKALFQAESMITIMEEENKRLKNLLSSLELAH